MFLAYVFQAFAIAAVIVVGTAFFLGLTVGRWRPQHVIEALNDFGTEAKLCDITNLVIGIFLVFFPWAFDLTAGIQSWNVAGTGIVIALLSVAALVGFSAWEEWGNLIAGLWLIASPWIVHLDLEAKWYQVTIGIIVAAMAKNELWFRAHRSVVGKKGSSSL
jgi:hypothetical protein